MKNSIIWLIGLVLLTFSLVYYFLKGNPTIVDATDPLPVLTAKSQVTYRFLHSTAFSDWLFSDVVSDTFDEELEKKLEQINRVFSFHERMSSPKSSILTFGLQKNKSEVLFTIQDQVEWNEARLDKLIKQLKEEKIDSKPVIDNNKSFFQLFFPESQQNLFVGISKGMLIGSAMRSNFAQLDTAIFNYAETQKNQFLISNKNFTSNQHSRVFIQLSDFNEIFSTFESQKLFNATLIKGQIASSTEVKSDVLLFDGTFMADKNLYFYELLQNQKPSISEIKNSFPESVSSFFQLSISDYVAFHLDAKAEIAQLNQLPTFEKGIENINKKYKTDLDESFKSWIGDEIGSCTISDKKDVIYFVKNKDKIASGLFFNELNRIDSLQKNINSSSVFYRNYKFIPINIQDFLNFAFGNILYKAPKQYTVLIDNYQLFSSSVTILKIFIDDYLSKGKLNNDTKYLKFSDQMSDESSFTYFSSGQEFSKNKESKISLAVQFVANAEGVNSYFQLSLKNKVSSNSTSGDPIWKLKIGSDVQIKPVIVENENKDRNLIIQDTKNQLYLISKAGKIKWKINVNASIISEIRQIALPNSMQSAFLFNTIDKIYLIDINGQNLDGFPIRLGFSATNSLSLFDYNSTKEFRIFVAGLNTISAFTIEGKSIPEWNNKIVKGEYTQAIKHLRILGRDYIFAATKNGTFYFFDRKGNEVKKIIDFSGSFYFNPFFLVDSSNSTARLITTNSKGRLKEIYPDGRLKTAELAEFGTDNQFSYERVSNTTMPAYIITDEDRLNVYGTDKALIFSNKFNEKLILPTQFFSLGNTYKNIGIVAKQAGQIFLYKEDGSLYSGFPKNGNSLFNIDYFTSKTERDVITGANDGFLYVYRL